LDRGGGCFCCYWRGCSSMPFGVTFVVLFCYAVFVVASFLRYTILAVQIVAGIETTVATLLFYVTYIHAVCRDPGYLPFNWAADGPTKYGWRELMSGTAVSDAQILFAVSTTRPPGTSFSKSYGRYVIRADHICGWISNWVGKRNHKHFLLMMAWGTIAAASLFGWRFAPREPIGGLDTVLGCLDIAAAVIEALFGLLLGISLSSFLPEAVAGQTRIQQFKGAERGEVSKRQALEEICGIWSMCCWICPTDAFPDEIELVDVGDRPVSD
jgi:hypothetical protein